MNRSTVAVVAVCWAACACVCSAAEWPHFRGPNDDGISPETGINKDWNARAPREVWKVPMTDDGYAGPAVAAGTVFIVDHKGAEDIVRAIDIEAGRDKWRFTYNDATKSNYGFARATPTYDKGRLYTVSRDGKLHCLDARAGRKLWMVDLRKDFAGKMPRWGYTSSVFVDGRALIVAPGGQNAAVVALDKMTGRTFWKGGGSDAPGYAMPVATNAFGKKSYVIFTAKAVMAVDAKSGRQMWRTEWKTSYDVNAATPLVVGRGVFITSNYGRGCAMVTASATSSRIAWENKDIQSHFNSPILHDGHIYSTSDRSGLVCMDPRTGAVKWKHRDFEKGGLIGVDGVMIVVHGKNGDVAMVELDSTRYRELGRIKPLGGQSWTAPVVADGKLLVRNKKALVCLDIK